MRLSDAIATGRVLVLKPAQHDLRGCVLGMAAKAVGIYVPDNICADLHPTYDEICNKWPWLNISAPDGNPWYINIFQMFDKHVMGDKTMTLDQLIDYVRSVEPTPEDELAATPETETVTEYACT